jgi:conjugal transfer ATP-binding protein TraC
MSGTQLRQYANLRVEDEDQAEKAQQWGPPGAQRQPVSQAGAPAGRPPAARRPESLTAGFHYTVRDFRLMLSVAFAGDAEDLNKREAN